MKNLYLTTAIALIASPALAEITPEELWQSWQDTTAELGVSLTAGQQEWQGDVLVLRDVKTSADLGFFSVDQSIDTLRLEALGDGSVAVSYDSPLSGNGGIDLPDTPSATIAITGQFGGTEGIVTGTADNYTYDFTVGSMQMDVLTEMSDGTDRISTATGTSRTRDLKGKIRFVETGAGMDISYAFSVGAIESTQETMTDMARSDGQIKQSQQTTAEGYTGNISFFLPTTDPNADSGRFLREGFTLDAQVNIEQINVSQRTASPVLNLALEMAQGPTAVSLTIDPQSASFSGGGEALNISVSNPNFGPQPYTVELAKTAATVAVPLYPSDSPQEARYAISLEGVTVSDSIWALFDPQNTLSRAPADFAIDARASIGLLLDWTNFEAAKSWQGPPAILHQIALQKFLIGFENARVTGEGAVDFLNEGPAPMPNGGALNFTLEGIPALLDKLGGLPMVDPGLMAGAQGMLGLFTSAGEGDTLTSKIEFGEGGAVMVNGQRVR